MDISRPSFLWDYDLSPQKIRAILHGTNHLQKDWLMARLLQHASWQTIWEYLDLSMLKDHLEHLPIEPSLKAHWAYATKRWK